MQHAGDNLHIVFNPVINLLEQDFLFQQVFADLFVGGALV